MINSKNLIDHVRLKFPDFEITEEMDLLPTVIFSFLSEKLVLAINNCDDITKKQFIELINEMAENEENLVIASLSEIVAVLYDQINQAEYLPFVRSLSPTAQNKFELIIKLWNSQFPN